MKYSRSLEDKHFKFMAKTIIGYTLKTPVPVVIIILAECVSTIDKLFPNSPVIRHTHIMLAANPLRNFSLKYFKYCTNTISLNLIRTDAYNLEKHFFIFIIRKSNTKCNNKSTCLKKLYYYKNIHITNNIN